ncbi:AAA family ATPase [Virgibacillus halophilus]|uniref:AAA family ATPase n=1 Tax=Tigheibacillus halophilus TaxID=361280 RepID=UPI00363F404F
MIIMINGAFGVGKTTVANRLQKELDNSMIFDPEEVGFMLRNIIPDDIKKPQETTDNFQDLLCWKVLVVDVVRSLRTAYQKDLILPMTIYNLDYLHYILQGLRSFDNHTSHFCLTAAESIIHQRLFARGEQKGNWCFQQTEKCLRAFHDQAFGQFVDTNRKTIDDVVNIILETVKQ